MIFKSSTDGEVELVAWGTAIDSVVWLGNENYNVYGYTVVLVSTVAVVESTVTTVVTFIKG